MTALLELREKIKSIYAQNEVFILPVIKLVLAFAVLSTLNSKMGYMAKIDNTAVVLIVALMCSFLPTGCIVLFAALFSLLHMYALSLEVAVVGVVIYMLLFLLFFRFGPKDSLAVVLTPLLCAWKVPYIMPIAMGLLGGPISAVSVACGVVVYYVLSEMITNAAAINTLAAEDMTAKLRLIIDAILHDKGMIVTAAAFAITVIVVYMVRRMSIDYAWTIAMVAGALVNLMVLLVGDLIYETNMSVMGAIFGNVIALAVAKVVEFFRFCVDYSRTEKVQFEDDEYYYYVKAIPKMTVTVSTRTVKRINAQQMAQTSSGRGSSVDRNRRNNSSGRYRTQNQRSRSVTIGEQPDDSGDDYEELS